MIETILTDMALPIILIFFTTGGFNLLFRVNDGKRINKAVDKRCKECNYKSFYDKEGIKQRQVKVSQDELTKLIRWAEKEFKQHLIANENVEPTSIEKNVCYSQFIVCMKLAADNIIKSLKAVEFTENSLSELSVSEIEYRAKNLFEEKVYKIFKHYYQNSPNFSRAKMENWSILNSSMILDSFKNIYNKVKKIH